MKFFNTDGVRGHYREILNSDVIDRISAYVGNTSKNIIIGYDTRESSIKILKKLLNKLRKYPVNIFVLGVCPTPMIQFMMNRYDHGIMITASHNPYFDNGIKLFNKDGKITSKEVDIIKNIKVGKYKFSNKSKVKKISVLKEYVDYINSLIDYKNNKKIIVDCANGTNSFLLKDVNLENIKIVNNTPNGRNINENVGSQHPYKLQEIVRENKYDYGIGFDGDGDRLIFVDKNHIYNGDDLLYLFSKLYKTNKVVLTTLSNRGLVNAFEKDDIEVYQVNVGDTNVINKMKEITAILGGEVSGHIILPNNYYSDGLVTLVKLVKALNEEVIFSFDKYYEISKNINNALMDEELIDKLNQIKKLLNESDYFLLRDSGTENYVRLNIQIKDYCRYLKVSKQLESLL
jgi:phosphoglucosamine mutase